MNAGKTNEKKRKGRSQDANQILYIVEGNGKMRLNMLRKIFRRKALEEEDSNSRRTNDENTYPTHAAHSVFFWAGYLQIVNSNH